MSPLVPPLSQQCYTCQSCCWRTSSVSLWSSAVSVGRQHRVNGVTGVLQGFLQLHQQPLQTQTHHITCFLIRRFSPLFSPLFLKCSSVDYSDNSTPLHKVLHHLPVLPQLTLLDTSPNSSVIF